MSSTCHMSMMTNCQPSRVSRRKTSSIGLLDGRNSLMIHLDIFTVRECDGEMYGQNYHVLFRYWQSLLFERVLFPVL